MLRSVARATSRLQISPKAGLRSVSASAESRIDLAERVARVLRLHESEYRRHCHHDPLDPGPVCRQDARTHATDADRVASASYASERLLDHPANCGGAHLSAVNVDAVLLEVKQRHVSTADEAAVCQGSDSA